MTEERVPAAWLLEDEDTGEALDTYKASEEAKARRVAELTGGVRVVPLYR